MQIGPDVAAPSPRSGLRTVVTTSLLTLIAAAAAAAPPSTGERLAAEASRTLGLDWSQVVTLNVPAEPGQPMLSFVPLDGFVYVLQLRPESVRSSGYQVLAQRADGTLEPVPPAPLRTLRGEVLGLPGSAVAGSLEENGLFAKVMMPTGEAFFVEPIAGRVAGAAAGDHVVYREQDIAEHGGTCGAGEAMRIGDMGDLAVPAGDGGVAGSGLCVTQLACDADYEYFLHWGSNVTTVQNRINSVINTMNLQYESQVGITHAITTIIVRTTSNDPYSSADAVTLLNQFRNHWNSSQGGIVRDVAELFTGRDMNGGTIGIAWLNAVCGSYGYNVVQSDFNNNFGCATDLSAHELGHNWGADHCSCTSNTMNPYITCANSFHPTFSIPEIIAFRDTRTCIDCNVPELTGACCVGTICSIQTEVACGNAGGIWWGDGSSCAGDPCAPPLNGACCVGSSCSIMTEFQCGISGGDWQGPDTDCAGDPCAPPPDTGACCVGTACTIETLADCDTAGGTWQGANTDCSGNPCAGDPGEAPLTGFEVVQSTDLPVGFLVDLVDSDDEYVVYNSASAGNKHRTDLHVFADSLFGSVASMTLTLETNASAPKVKTTVYLRRVANNKWTRISSFNASSPGDGVHVLPVSDPNRFIAGDGTIQLRVFTERRGGIYNYAVDHVEITVTP